MTIKKIIEKIMRDDNLIHIPIGEGALLDKADYFNVMDNLKKSLSDFVEEQLDNLFVYEESELRDKVKSRLLGTNEKEAK